MKEIKEKKLKKIQKWVFSKLTGFKIEDLGILKQASAYNEYAEDGLGDGLNDTFLFDFKNYGSGYSRTNGGVFISQTFQTPDGSIIRNADPIIDANGNSIIEGYGEVKPVPVKVSVKPKDVLHELETIPTPWNLTNLDDKIEVLKQKRELIVQKYSRREVEALIERLENRKKYAEHQKFFLGFQNTTDEKIDTLIDKYENLVMKTSDLFVPEFPDEAIKIMEDYTNKMKKICDKKPVFYVIAEEDKFRKADEKRDPILLVQSPFGFYWQILGAWDEEMILLSEL